MNAAVMIAILGVSAFITHWFARTMYIRCEGCGTLNARRRKECRSCQVKLYNHEQDQQSGAAEDE